MLGIDDGDASGGSYASGGSFASDGEFVPTPADHVEFASRLGIDAVMCELAYQSNIVTATAPSGGSDGAASSCWRVDQILG